MVVTGRQSIQYVVLINIRTADTETPREVPFRGGAID